MSYRFEVLKDFHGDINGHKQKYWKGGGYTVRDGNVMLHGLVQDWAKEGKVRIIEDKNVSFELESKPSVLHGTGRVVDTITKQDVGVLVVNENGELNIGE